MNLTKPIFTLKTKLWFRDISNAVICRFLIMFGHYHKVIRLQSRHIKKLERHNEYTQTYIALSYLRMARGHIRMNQYVRAIDNLWMIIHTYSYVNWKVIRLFRQCYRILLMNSSDIQQKKLWIDEQIKDFHTINTTLENQKK